MKAYSNFYFALFSNLFLLVLIIGCNPTSTAYFLYDGKNYDRQNNNALLFGRIVDKDTNAPLVGANVTLNDYRLGAATDIYGNYLIKDIPPGTYRIRAAYIGYEALFISDVNLDTNKIYLIDFKLLSEPIIVQ